MYEFDGGSAQETTTSKTSDRYSRIIQLIIVGVVTLVFAALGIVGFVIDSKIFMFVSGIVAGIGMLSFGLIYTREDRIRADQTTLMLGIASSSASYMRHGLEEEPAKEVCKQLLPVTGAISVAIVDMQGQSIAHVGADVIWDIYGDPIPIPWAKRMFDYGASFVIRTDEDEPLPTGLKACVAALIQVQSGQHGMLKLYYRRRGDIGENQQAMAVGFAELLTLRLAQTELARQTEIATEMELRALQAQINPHFLFNTINTIAALIRTDPKKAREMLREFAIFYRRTLESSEGNITVELELAQTKRYLLFEKARFGEDRIIYESNIEQGLENVSVPAFIVQPLVENSVGHAMRDNGEPLHILVEVKSYSDDGVIINVTDDGVGMDDTAISVAIKSDGRRGAGIAIKNVDDRLKSCFAPGSGLNISSELGRGTTVTLTLAKAKKNKIEEEEEND